MKNIYDMDETELRNNLTDALLRWQEAEQQLEYYGREIKILRDKLAAVIARQAEGTAEAANG